LLLLLTTVLLQTYIYFVWTISTSWVTL